MSDDPLDFDEEPPDQPIGQGADLERTEPQPIVRRARAPQREALPPSPPDRSPPHSAEAEEHVIACCLLDEGATLARAAQDGLTADSFYFPANRLIFETLCTLPMPALDLLVGELQTRRQLEAVGGLAYLMQVTGKIPTTAHAAYFIEKVKEKATLRQAIRAATQTVEEAYSFTGGLDEFLQKASARTEALAAQSGTAAARKATVITRLQSRRVTLTAKPTEPVTRLFLAKKPVATPGNLTTIISRAKTGKTAAIGGAVAAIIAAHADRHDLDCLGFSAPHTDEAVIVLDTEQSPYDAWTCHQRMMARAGEGVMPPWLHHHALVGYSALELREALPIALDAAKAQHKGIFTLILDGVADFVTSVNDEAECNAFVAHLHGLAVDYNCAVLAVIHSNEAIKAGDDGRGHLGKQLTRKAESNLLLKKTGNVTVITSDKQRKAPITEADGVAFEWSDEQGRHISCGTVADDKTGPGRPPKYDAPAMLACFPGPKDKPVPLGQVYRTILQLPCGISDRAFKDWAAKWIQTGEVVRTGDRKVGFGFARSQE